MQAFAQLFSPKIFSSICLQMSDIFLTFVSVKKPIAMYTLVDYLVISILLTVIVGICVAWMKAVPCPKWLNKVLSEDYDDILEKYRLDD